MWTEDKNEQQKKRLKKKGDLGRDKDIGIKDLERMLKNIRKVPPE